MPSMTLTKSVLSKYNSDYFIETGSGTGGAIELALDVKFKKIFSCERDLNLFNVCKDKFQDKNHVFLYNSISIDFLKTIQTSIPPDASLTFWLDAHCFYSTDENNLIEFKDIDESPILNELEIIYKYPNPYTIMIDDLRVYRQEEEKQYFGSVTYEDILNSIKNSKIKFEEKFEDGLIENDILILTKNL